MIPALVQTRTFTTRGETFPGWPTHFEGQPLLQLELSEREKSFNRGFPGTVGRFSDGSRELLIRWIKRESRMLHPAADCMRGAGYAVRPERVRLDKSGNMWSCISAAKSGKKLKICERIYDQSGQSWPDPSAWYWSAILGKTSGPWWSLTVLDG